MPANSQPPAAPLGAPLDSSNPATQVYHNLLPSPRQIVFRPGAVRGTTSSNQRGPICGTFDEVRDMAQSIYLTPNGGPEIALLLDGTDPANPNGTNVHVPASGTYDFPPSMVWEFAVGTTDIILESGCRFTPNWFPVLRGSIESGVVSLQSQGGGAPFSFTTGNRNISIYAVQFGDGTNPVINVTTGATLNLYGDYYADINGTSIISSDFTGGLFVFLTRSCNIINLGGVISVAVRMDSTCTSGVTPSFLELAQYIGFSPSTPGNWPIVPNNIAAALNSLAAGAGSGGSSLAFTDPTGSVLATNVLAAVQEVLSTQILYTPNAVSHPSPQVGRIAINTIELGAITASSDVPLDIAVDLFTSSSTALIDNLTLYAPRFRGIPNGTGTYPIFDLGSFTVAITNGVGSGVVEFEDIYVTNSIGGSITTTADFEFVLRGVSTLRGSASGPLVVPGSDPVIGFMYGLSQLGDGTNAVFADTNTITLNMFDGSSILAGVSSHLTINKFSTSVSIDPSYVGVATINDFTGGIPSLPGSDGTYDLQVSGGVGTWIAAGGGGGAPFDTTFRPNGTGGVSLYVTETALNSALSSMTQSHRVYFDFSQVPGGANSFNATEDWTLGESAEFIGLPFGAAATGIFTAFTISPSPITIRNLFIWSQGFSSSVFPALPALLYVTGTSYLYSSGAPLYTVTTTGHEVYLTDLAVMDGTGGGPCIAITLSGSVTLIINSLAFQLLSEIPLMAGAITVDSGGSLAIYAQSYSQIDPSYFGMTGVNIYITPLGTQFGTATLSNGTVTVTANVAPGQAIQVAYNTPTGILGVLTVPGASRTTGSPGSFVINSVDPSTLVVNTADQSTVDWIVVD